MADEAEAMEVEVQEEENDKKKVSFEASALLERQFYCFCADEAQC